MLKWITKTGIEKWRQWFGFNIITQDVCVNLKKVFNDTAPKVGHRL